VPKLIDVSGAGKAAGHPDHRDIKFAIHLTKELLIAQAAAVARSPRGDGKAPLSSPIKTSFE
jgi:hypothetical protein